MGVEGSEVQIQGGQEGVELVATGGTVWWLNEIIISVVVFS